MEMYSLYLHLSSAERNRKIEKWFFQITAVLKGMPSLNENARIEAFSDGVYAIAITLLVLEINVPAVDAIHSVSDLWRELLRLWPSFFAFLLSFGFTLISWINHHNTFNLINKSSQDFFYTNGFLLLGVVLVPFSTAL